MAGSRFVCLSWPLSIYPWKSWSASRRLQRIRCLVVSLGSKACATWASSAFWRSSDRQGSSEGTAQRMVTGVVSVFQPAGRFNEALGSSWSIAGIAFGFRICPCLVSHLVSYCKHLRDYISANTLLFPRHLLAIISFRYCIGDRLGVSLGIAQIPFHFLGNGCLCWPLAKEVRDLISRVLFFEGIPSGLPDDTLLDARSALALRT